MDDNKKAAVCAVSRTLSTLADGTVRLKIDFEPCDREIAMKLFGEPGTSIAIAAITLESAETQLRAEFSQDIKKDGEYDAQAKELKLSSFFRTKSVWKKIGTDEEYLSWIRKQSCAYCKSKSNEHKPIEAAHIRRIAAGAGIGIKPEYSAIPLCTEHHKEQHQHGEIVLGGKEWFERRRVEYISRWAWESLKKQLGYSSWSHIPPKKLYEWAVKNSVEVCLAPIYLDNQ